MDKEELEELAIVVNRLGRLRMRRSYEVADAIYSLYPGIWSTKDRPLKCRIDREVAAAESNDAVIQFLSAEEKRLMARADHFHFDVSAYLRRRSIDRTDK